MKPIVALTMGDINGIGPEILAKGLAHAEVWDWCQPVIIGSARAYDEARRFQPDAPAPDVIDDPAQYRLAAGRVAVIETDVKVPPTRPGVLDPEAGRCAVKWIMFATELAMRGAVDAIVTCPIQKEGIHRAGYTYPGHTDLIAELTDSPDYRMCLFTDTMRIVHISSHCSLRQALDYVKKDRIADSIRIGHRALVKLGLPQRRIAVAGLNPHAGEGGAFGSEEQDEIRPAVEQCRAEGIDCSGPYPPDTLFGRMRDGEFEMVIAMYHDQGHIPLKLIAMDEGVNVTLGIPIVRTSVDHGTAYDIAGRGVARENSLCAAIHLAAQLAGLNRAVSAEQPIP